MVCPIGISETPSSERACKNVHRHSVMQDTRPSGSKIGVVIRDVKGDQFTVHGADIHGIGQLGRLSAPLTTLAARRLAIALLDHSRYLLAGSPLMTPGAEQSLCSASRMHRGAATIPWNDELEILPEGRYAAEQHVT